MSRSGAASASRWVGASAYAARRPRRPRVDVQNKKAITKGQRWCCSQPYQQRCCDARQRRSRRRSRKSIRLQALCDDHVFRSPSPQYATAAVRGCVLLRRRLGRSGGGVLELDWSA